MSGSEVDYTGRRSFSGLMGGSGRQHQSPASSKHHDRAVREHFDNGKHVHKCCFVCSDALVPVPAACLQVTCFDVPVDNRSAKIATFPLKELINAAGEV
jgi:hypothetical protein